MGKSLIPEFLRDLCALCGEKFGLATEYTEITEETIQLFRVFRGYLRDISLS